MKTKKMLIYVSRYYKKYDKFGPTGELLAIQTSLDREKSKSYCSVIKIDQPDDENKIKKLLISTFKRISAEINKKGDEVDKHTGINIKFNRKYSISAEILYNVFTLDLSKNKFQSFLGVSHEILLKKPVKEKDIDLFIKVLGDIPFLGWGTKNRY